MNFSLILASRERVHLLETLLSSVESTTSDKSNCEIICVIDSDDRNTKRHVDRWKSTYSLARFITKERSPNLNNDYLNWAWRNHATGENIIILNDDVVFKTPNWDQIILHHLNNYLADKPDGVVYGWIEDGLKNRAANLDYCCFPLVTRKAANVLGFVMPPEFPGWGADIGLYRIYSAINRIFKIPSVILDHLSYHTGTRNKDHINQSVENKSIGTVCPLGQFNPATYIDMLLKHMNGINNVPSISVFNATIDAATLVDVTIVGGKIIGGKREGNRIIGGRIEGGIITSGTVAGELKDCFVGNQGNIKIEEINA